MINEIRRKAIHLIGLFIPIFYYVTDDRKLTVLLVGAGTIAALAIELIKFSSRSFRHLFLRFLSPLLRSHEKRENLTGATYFLIGSLIAVAFFPRKIAIACTAFLVLGDLFAAIIGKRWGRIKLLAKKSLEGSLACFLVCFAVTLLIRINPIIGLIGALIATCVELFSTAIEIDDNLAIPVVSGVVMWWAGQLLISVS